MPPERAWEGGDRGGPRPGTRPEGPEGDTYARRPRREATTLVLAIVSAVACGLVLGTRPGERTLALAWTALLCAAAWLARRSRERSSRGATTIPWLAGSVESHRGAGASGRDEHRLEMLLAGMMAAPFLAYVLRLQPFGPSTMELLFLAGLRNVALGSAAAADRPKMLRFSVHASLFTMIFAFSLRSGLGLLVAAAAYAVVGVVWLMQGNWAEVSLCAAGRHRAGLPWKPAVALSAAAVLGCLVGVLAYPENADKLLDRMLGIPSVSAGIDAWKRERLSRSNLATMQGLTDELYGQEATRRRDQSATPGNAGATSGPRQERQAEEEQEKQLDFSLFRQPNTPGDPNHRDPEEVLFQANGSGPMHLPVTTYEEWDGQSWEQQQAASAAHFFAEIDGKQGWTSTVDSLDFLLDPSAASEPTDTPSVSEAPVEWGRSMARQWTMAMQGGGRLVNRTRLPLTPGQLERLTALGPGHPNGVDPRQIISPYDLEKIEQIIRSRVSAQEAGQLKNMSDQDFQNVVLREYLKWRMEHGTESLPPRVRKLVDGWIAGHEKGWDEIQAVVAGLRSHAVHDREATVPLTAEDPLEYFLLESRRGPDYLFASAAAVILRHLGYPSRMVSGFYVQPEGLSRLTGATPVKVRDVHFWPQVRLRQLPNENSPEEDPEDEVKSFGQWVNLEPTPGYEAPCAEKPWSTRFAENWRALGQRLRRYAWTIGGIGLALAAALTFRLRLLERLATLLWLARTRRPPDRLVAATWRLVERRSRVAGHRRPPGRTLRAWYPPLAGAPEARRRLVALADLADWSLHAPGGLASGGPWSAEEVRRACRETVRECTVSTLGAAEE